MAVKAQIRSKSVTICQIPSSLMATILKRPAEIWARLTALWEKKIEQQFCTGMTETSSWKFDCTSTALEAAR